MKRINILLPVVISIFFSSTLLHAQVKTPKAKFDLKGAERLEEMMPIVEEFYASRKNKSPKFESDYQKWKRWEWYMSSHLGPGGEFVDIGNKLWKANKQVRQNPVETNRSIHSNWSSIGPHTSPLANPKANYNGIGRVSRVAFHPTSPNTIFIGTPFGGLWKTTNGGTTWNALTDHLPSLSVSGIVISHENPNHIYILTGDGDGDYNSVIALAGYTGAAVGVLKSVDGGESWFETGSFSHGGHGYQLIQDPIDPNVLLAATSKGLYRTDNGGESWSLRKSGRSYDVDFNQANSDTAYLARPSELLYSINNGETWYGMAEFDPPITGGGRMQIAVSQNSPSRVYAVSGPSETGEFKGLWKSTDSGINFVRQSNTPNILGKNDDGSDAGHQSHYNLAIAASPNNASKIVVGALSAWRSENGGSDWVKSTSYSEGWAFPYIHPDIHDLQYNPLNQKLYATNDGGIYVSADHGITWDDLTEGIRTTMFFHMRTWNNLSSKMLGGCQDNGVKYRRNATTAWHHISQADGFDVVFNPLTGEPAHATINRGITRYFNDADSSKGVTPIGDTLIWFKTVAIHNTRPDTVLLGSDTIKYSHDAGDNWTKAGPSGTWTIASCPSNNSKFYAAGGMSTGPGNETNSGAYVSTDIGVTWTSISTNTGFPQTWTKITDIVPNPINSHTVYATFGGFGTNEKVFRSFNSGQSWTNMTDNLPDVAVYCIGVDTDNSLYLGTDIGVFYRTPGMAGWMFWSNGLPRTPVTDIAVQNSFVRCSTLGRGAWQSLKANGCTAGLVLAAPLAGDIHYETSDFITSTSDINSGLGTAVFFKAGDRVDLKTGFEVTNHSEFIAQTGPCGTGGIPPIWYAGVEEQNAIRTNGTPVELDIKHGFPLGSIDHLQINGSQSRADITVRTKGTVSFVLLKDGNETLLFRETMDPEAVTIELNTDGVRPGFYTLMMYNDGRVAHYQEYLIE